MAECIKCGDYFRPPRGTGIGVCADCRAAEQEALDG